MNRSKSFLGVLYIGKKKFLGCIEKHLDNDFILVRIINIAFPHKSCIKIACSSDFTPLQYSLQSNELETLIKNLKESMILSSKTVKKAFCYVDRKHFISKDPYCDSSPDLLEGKYDVCISTPRVHVLVAELLLKNLSFANLCLDVGSGSGFFTVLMQVLAPQSQVYGIDYHADLIDQSKLVLEQHYPSELEKIYFIKGDGKNGIEGKIFDVIHVGFMCDTIPIQLLKQLSVGGRMLLPLSSEQKCSFDDRCLSGKYLCIDKVNEKDTIVTELFSCFFVPDACNNSVDRKVG